MYGSSNKTNLPTLKMRCPARNLRWFLLSGCSICGCYWSHLMLLVSDVIALLQHMMLLLYDVIAIWCYCYLILLLSVHSIWFIAIGFYSNLMWGVFVQLWFSGLILSTLFEKLFLPTGGVKMFHNLSLTCC